MGILQKGGNAFDATVAGGFVLQVADFNQNSLGGEVVILANRTGTDTPKVICGHGLNLRGEKGEWHGRARRGAPFFYFFGQCRP
ncbi:gamma-glutamyltransferase [Bradyrhizobium sp. CB1015]|uniref:gamma-glutamyltransferase n=1 Tax=Bradyrhizobium sp. CB1015 TaxID=2976822 RepID=UPI003906360F